MRRHPPETEPANAPSSRTAITLPACRGAEPQVLITVPSATPGANDLQGILIQPLRWDTLNPGMEARVTRKTEIRKKNRMPAKHAK